MNIKEKMVRDYLQEHKKKSTVLANDLALTHNIIGSTDTVFKQMFKKLGLEAPKGKYKLSKKQKRNKITPFSLKDKRWFALRRDVFNKYGQTCMKCGSTENIQVDHIKPKSKYPKLAYDINNLQVLCADCNSEKSNRNCDDFREKYAQEECDAAALLEIYQRGY